MSRLFCKRCALDDFSSWKGVPWKDCRRRKDRRKYLLPQLKPLERGQCAECGTSDPVAEEDIFYLNVGPGLPNYWALVIKDTKPDYVEGELDGPQARTLNDTCQLWCRDRFGCPYPDDYVSQQRILVSEFEPG